MSMGITLEEICHWIYVGARTVSMELGLIKDKGTKNSNVETVKRWELGTIVANGVEDQPSEDEDQLMGNEDQPTEDKNQPMEDEVSPKEVNCITGKEEERSITSLVH
ncbi:unnamed protein product [Nezara viridula]|uniref:Uncharacterized protein n=1 Tax=Nezara viridula TaxID=85310 RepID=A0A9P0EFG6_NEZVI|nr:unnamed protein product [Nezara viridula]